MLDEDLQQLIRAILLVVGAILPIVNPVGSAPMFLAMTHGADSATRRALAGHVAVNSFVLLLSSLIFGNFVLRLSAFIVLCIGVQIAWNGVKALVEEFPFAAPLAPAVEPKR